MGSGGGSDRRLESTRRWQRTMLRDGWRMSGRSVGDMDETKCDEKPMKIA